MTEREVKHMTTSWTQSHKELFDSYAERRQQMEAAQRRSDELQAQKAARQAEIGRINRR